VQRIPALDQVDQLVDSRRELAFVHEDHVGGQAGVKLDLVECCDVGRVGRRQAEAVGTTQQRQQAMLAQQLRVDQIPRAIREVESIEIEQRRAEFLRGGLGNLATLGHLVLHQVGDKGDLVPPCCAQRILGLGFGDQTVRDQALGKAAEGNCHEFTSCRDGDDGAGVASIEDHAGTRQDGRLCWCGR
jgi:hypothetical protein